MVYIVSVEIAQQNKIQYNLNTECMYVFQFEQLKFLHSYLKRELLATAISFIWLSIDKERSD